VPEEKGFRAMSEAKSSTIFSTVSSLRSRGARARTHARGVEGGSSLDLAREVVEAGSSGEEGGGRRVDLEEWKWW
jgi:hypothetical protein